MTFARLHRTVLAAFIAAVALALPAAQIRHLAGAASYSPAATAQAEHVSYSTDLTQVALAHGDVHASGPLQHATTAVARVAPTPPVGLAATVSRTTSPTVAYVHVQGARAPPASR